MFGKQFKRLLLMCFLVCVWLHLAARSDKVSDSARNEGALLQRIARMVEKNHYHPKIIDDQFSEALFHRYIAALDPLKATFLERDIDSLERYSFELDDEIHGSMPFTFVSNVYHIYVKRLNEVMAIDKRLLAEPFTFDGHGVVDPDGGSTDDFAENEAQLTGIRRRMLKYVVLQYFAALQKNNPQYSNAVLERVAVQKAGAWRRRQYHKFLRVADEAGLFDEFVNTMMHIMDPHTDYVSSRDERNYAELTGNRYWGIGVRLADDTAGGRIAAIQPGSPAAKDSAVQVDDVIIRVGQGAAGGMQHVAGMSAADITKLIYGGKGTTVRLTVKRADGRINETALVRSRKENADAFVKTAVIQDSIGRIGYITFPMFYSDSTEGGAHCADDVARALRQLDSAEVDGIIFDLRNNPGGSLMEVLHMVGLLVDGGPVVQVKRRMHKSVALQSTQKKAVYTGPLAVMVNEKTASAAEIFTAAIKDYGRGVVIGSQTYGKGTVQRPFLLGKGNGFLKLTFEQFFRINGSSTQMKGIVPDIILPDSYTFQKVREKDNLDALSWDSITPAKYKKWKTAAVIPALKRLEEKKVEQDSAFGLIRGNNARREKLQHEKVSLNLSLYKKLLAEKAGVAMRYKKLQTLPPADRLTVFEAGDTLSGDLKRKWLTKISADLYISKTVQVINDMILLETHHLPMHT